MIFIEAIKGCRIGNILFQYAFALSKQKEVTFVCLDEETYQYLIEYKQYFWPNAIISTTIPNSSIFRYSEPSYRCHQYLPLDFPDNSDIFIRGYFQSYKYFKREIIIREVTCPECVKKEIQNRFPELMAGAWTSIHVRRGDFLNKKNKWIHPVCEIGYYKKAMKLFPTDMKYIIISDDIPWCREKFIGNNFVFADKSNPLMDFFLPSYCQNNIISNSSFVWWAAFLNNHIGKKIVAPSMWLGYSAKIPVHDLHTPDTIVIDNHVSFHFLIDYIRTVIISLNRKIKVLLVRSE